MLKKNQHSASCAWFLTSLNRLDPIPFLSKFKKSGKLTASLLLSIALTGSATYAQSTFKCGNDSVNSNGTAGKPSPTASCGKASAIFSSFFTVKESFKPIGNIKPETVIKKVKVRFVIADPQVTGTKRNFDVSTADQAVLQTIIDNLNQMNQFPDAPVGSPAGCTTCTQVPDNRIRYEMAGVSIFPSRSFYQPDDFFPDFSNKVVNGDAELNIFLAYFPLGGPNAWVGITNPLNSNITKFNFYSDPTKDYIVMANAYQRYLGDGNTYNLTRSAIHHELFHEYGLWHVNDGTETCVESNPDFLGDIFGFGANKVCPLTGTSTSNDVMMGGAYASYNQLEIMHRELFQGRMHKYAYPNESVTNHIWVVNSSQTWDFPIRMFQTIRVMPGATLTIKCEVQMPENSNIIVELGGRLVLDGGTITSYNQRLAWGGLQIKGNQNNPEQPQYQGVLEMKNGSVIENAWEGVWNYSPENWFTGNQHGGGIILAQDSRFHNCNKAVDVGGYEVYSSIYGGVSQCSFQRMTFDIDQNSPFFTHYQQDGYEYFTSDRQKSGMLIQNCTFKNDISYSYQWTGRRGRAIRISETGANILNNTFDGFVFGVKTENYTGTPRNSMIRGNTFTRVSENIMVANAGYTNVLSNKISNIINSDTGKVWGTPKYFPGTGIFLDNAAGAYVGCGNVIDGTPQAGYPADNTRDYVLNRRGIVIQNSNTFGGTVIDNTINNIAVGTQTQKNNPLLYIYCNTYNRNTTAAWQVNPQSTTGYTLNNQGTGCLATLIRAGNVFNSNTKDIANYITTPWHYYAFGNIASQVPTNNISFSPSFCTIAGATTDPKSQCNGASSPRPNFTICNTVLVNAPIHVAQIGDYYGFVKAGQKYSVDANISFHEVVNGFYDLDDEPGLISFLEAEQDDNSRRLLLPLYLENSQFTNLQNAINAMSISTDEKNGYNTYYGILANMYTTGNTVNNLNAEDINNITVLAHSNLEVSPYAKAILDITGKEEWIHSVEEVSGSPFARGVNPSEIILPKSMLYTAAPNPTRNETVIKTFIAEEDQAKNPLLVITSITGKELASYHLTSGESYNDISTKAYAPGLYLYTLQVNGHAVETKKLSIVK